MDRAERRHRKQRKIAEAAKKLAIWKLEYQAPKRADNMANCGCWMCSPLGRRTKPVLKRNYNVNDWMAWAKEDDNG